jgi:hypothetical protein
VLITATSHAHTIRVRTRGANHRSSLSGISRRA